MAKRAPVENRVVTLSALSPHDRNYNKHSDAQVNDLRESLRQFGQVRSIVVQPRGKRFVIVAGHGIVTAAQAEGLMELRADVIPATWSETRVLAYLAADNELAKRGDPDQDQLAAIVRDVMEAEGEALARLAAGEQSALDALLAASNPIEETADAGELVDKAAELQKKWQVQRGDVWQIGRHRLMCGDSTSADDVARLMDEKKAKVTFIDPPYNALKSWKKDEARGETRLDPSKWFDNDNMSWEEYAAFLTLAFSNMQGHSVYVCCDFRIYSIIVDKVKEAGYDLKHCIVWKKNVWGLGKRYRFQHEFIVYACKKDAPFYGDRAQSDVWEIDIRKTNEHNTPKPYELPMRAIVNSSESDEIVLDLFCGSGTSIVASEMSRRICYAMEKAERYCAVTLERLALLGLKPERITEHGKQKQAKITANSEKSGRQTRHKSRVIGEPATVS